MTYPEHEKLAAKSSEHKVISDWLHFLEYRSLFLTRWDPDTLEDVRLSPKERDQLIADYFEIDFTAFLAEKEQMLADLRNLQ